MDDYAVFGMCLVRIGAIGEEFIPYKWMMQNAPDNIFINVGSGWYYSNQNIESEQVKGQKYLQRSIALL